MKKYLAEMLYALTSAYSHKDYENRHQGAPPETNIGKLFSVFAWGLDMVQEQADLIRLWDELENARGVALDRYGANFGVKRNGTSDVFYRLAIRVKVIAQISGGDTDTVIKAAAELLGVEFSDIQQEDVFPAKVALYVDQSLLSEERLELIELIAQAIKRILAAGIGMRLYLRTHRTYRSTLLVSRTVWSEMGLMGDLIGEDRVASEAVSVQFKAVERSEFQSGPTDMPRDARLGLPVARRAMQMSSLESILAPAEQVDTGQPGGTGGVLYSTRIKPKRIE